MLVGREGDLRRLRHALDRHRMATLVGPGGVGKTTLARALAEEYPADSVLFATLAPLSAPDLVEAVVGQFNCASFDEFLGEASSQQWLVVLDNCEHVLDAAAELAEILLAAADKVRVLATSRERLDLPEEQVLRLDPLATEGSPSPAAELFLAVADRRGGPDLRSSSLDHVEELCRRLDGLPLAVELAAARSTTMTAAEMLGHLDGSLGLLSRRRARGPDRHRSLSAAIEWSYRDLERDERRLFDALGVFGGPFTLEMAAAAFGESPEATASLLAGMVERSLVVHDPVARTSWYRQLATIRSFAAERLRDTGYWAGAESRLQSHLVARADALDATGLGATAAGPVELRQSYRSFHRAIERAMDQGNRDRCHRLVVPLWWMALLGHQAEARELVARVVARWDDDSPETAAARGILASLTRVSRGVGEAAEIAGRAIEHDGLGRAFGGKTLGQVASVEGRWDDALDEYRRAAEAARSVGADGLAVEVDNLAAMALARKGEVDRAVERLEANLAATEGSELANVWTADYLASVLLTIDHRRSAELAGRAGEVAERSDNVWIAGSANATLAFAALLDDRLDLAAERTVRSLQAFRSIRDRVDITTAFLAAAALFERRGDRAGAHGALAAEVASFATVHGSFESALLAQAGPLPERDRSVPPMAVGDMIDRLENGVDPSAEPSSRSVGPATDLGPETGAGAGPSAGPDADGAPADGNRFVLLGDSWEITYGGVTILQRDSKGLQDLARLLAAEGREIPAVDLVDAQVVAGDAGPSADAAARAAYRDRVSELERELVAADESGDSVRSERAQAELDRLVDELGRSYGLGGRDRVQGAPAEKARTAVTARIRSAIRRIDAAHPVLGRHLANHVQTGRLCAYRGRPDRPWELG